MVESVECNCVYNSIGEQVTLARWHEHGERNSKNLLILQLVMLGSISESFAGVELSQQIFS